MLVRAHSESPLVTAAQDYLRRLREPGT
jgi:hypothetical protein